MNQVMEGDEVGQNNKTSIISAVAAEYRSGTNNNIKNKIEKSKCRSN